MLINDEGNLRMALLEGADSAAATGNAKIVVEHTNINPNKAAGLRNSIKAFIDVHPGFRSQNTNMQ